MVFWKKKHTKDGLCLDQPGAFQGEIESDMDLAWPVKDQV